MAHDFAKQRPSDGKSGKPRPQTKSATKVSAGASHWPWFFSGLISGLFVAVIGFFGLYQPSLLQNAGSALLGQDASDTENGTEEGTDLTFYNRLSEAEVVVDVVGVELEPEVEENPTVYRVQAASFNSLEDAENFRAELLLLGLDASIYRAEVLGQIRYRVQAGPFIGNASAEDAIDLLARNNINGAIKIEVRQ